MSRLFERLSRRINNLFQRGTVTLVDDSTDIQQLQVTLRNGQVRENREHPTNYGFAHHPHKSSEDIHMASQSGNTEKGIVILVGDRKYRLKDLEEGEVALYDDLGQVVHLKRDGILIKSPTKVTIDAPQSIFKGNVTIEQNLVVMGASFLQGAVTAMTSIATPILNAALSLIVAGKEMLTHTHPGDSGGNTGNPN